MSYQPNDPGDWGSMQEGPGITIATEELLTKDGRAHFLRSWETGSSTVLLILHGLGGHSGWYIDMGNMLASHGFTVYAMDHRGFGRSDGLRGHIDDYHTYLEDIQFIIFEIRKRHPEARIYLFGHSMGGLFAAHFVARYGDTLAGVFFLNLWIQDTIKLPFLTMIAILLGGLFKSRHYWQVDGGTELMTTNPDAIRMLQGDPFWQHKQTASFLFQTLLMRLLMNLKTGRISMPALVMQAEADKSVVIEVNRKFYEALASSDKTWKTYPNYSHDSEFEHDRSQLDSDIVTWLIEHSTTS